MPCSCVAASTAASAAAGPDDHSASRIAQATALVQEAYVRLVGNQDIRWDSRAHFLAAVASDKGDHSRGLELIDGALVVFRNQLGENNVEVGQALRSRALCLKGLGNLDEALRDARAALVIFDVAVVPTERGRLRAVADITELLCLQGSYDAAEQMAKEALKLLDPDNTTHQKSIKNLRDKLSRCRDGSPALSGPPTNSASNPPSGK